jgi:putative ABC transport system permease protein
MERILSIQADCCTADASFMIHARLVIKNVLRNRRRTILTVGSICVSVFLLAIFFSTYRYLNEPPGLDRTHLVLMVANRTSITNPMPVSYRSRIESVQGVSAVSPIFWFDSRYKNPDNIIPALACDPERIFQIFSDWTISDDQRQTFIGEQDAMIAGRKVIEKYGWKIGDHIHVSSPNYLNVPIDLVLRGMYTSPGDEGFLAFHWTYLNEALGRPNRAGYFYVLADSAEDVPRVMKAIDEEFRNSPVETRTQTVKQVALGFLGWLGNVKRILLIVTGAVVFAVLLVVANTMAMSIRERTTEIAVLRALGFRVSQLLMMLTAEAVAMSVAGAVLGCVLASVACVWMARYRIGGAMQLNLHVDLATIGVTLMAALLISLASTLIPAYRASRSNIARAIRFVG